MGNLPLSKRTGIEYEEYSEAAKGRFTRSFRPYDMSFEDLRPTMSKEGRHKDWTDMGDTTILGLEMNQELVCPWESIW